MPSRIDRERKQQAPLVSVELQLLLIEEKGRATMTQRGAVIPYEFLGVDSFLKSGG